MTRDFKEMAIRYVDNAWNRGNLDVLDDLMTPDFVDHGASAGETSSLEEHKDLIRMTRSAFPDLFNRVEDLVSEDNKVAIRWTAEGTHQGKWRGIAPTGKRIAISGVTILRIEGERSRSAGAIMIPATCCSSPESWVQPTLLGKEAKSPSPPNWC
ncbi:MAG: ester cyclase [Actinomycetota bacterium]